MTLRTFIVAALLALLSASSLAQSCAPAPWGPGTPAVLGADAQGYCAAWHCDDGYQVMTHRRAGTWAATTEQMRAEFAALQTAADKAVAIDQMSARHITTRVEDDPSLKAIFDRMCLAGTLASRPPTPVWRVPPLSGYLDRPTYVVEPSADGNGLVRRQTKVRVPINTLCDMGMRFPEPTGSVYAAVTPDGLVALCKRVAR